MHVHPRVKICQINVHMKVLCMYTRLLLQNEKVISPTNSLSIKACSNQFKMRCLISTRINFVHSFFRHSLKAGSFGRHRRMPAPEIYVVLFQNYYRSQTTAGLLGLTKLVPVQPVQLSKFKVDIFGV